MEVAQTYHTSALLDAVEDALALFDDQDRLVRCNRAYVRLFAEDDESALAGRTALELLEAWLSALPLDEATDRQGLLSLHPLGPGQRSISFAVHTKDGRRFRVTDRRSGARGRVRTVRELIEYDPATEGRTATTDGSSAGTAKLELLSWMNRKLLTPLNAMLGFAQIMQADRREPLTLRHRARLDRILQSGEHLALLIDDCVDFARLEAGTAAMALEPTEPMALIREVIHALEHPAVHPGTSILLEMAASAVPLVLVDRRRFARVLKNFAANAVKHNHPSGAVRFVVSVPRSDRVRIAVHDNGDGIPLDRQLSLFRPLERVVEGVDNQEIPAMGLAIAKHLAELMGGAVGCKSTPGAGAEFWVEAPTSVA